MQKKKQEAVNLSAPPVMTPEARESQLIALAVDCVEQRMRDGTATAQELCYYLKLGSQKERLERQIMEEQAKLYRAKADAIASAKETAKLYDDAIAAMRRYSGNFDEHEEELY